MTIIVRPNGAEQSRLGLAVPRRVARHAVVRHRLKRQIRESFRHTAEHLAGLDIVVIAKSGAGTMDSKRFRGVLAKAWERAAGRVRTAEKRR